MSVKTHLTSNNSNKRFIKASATGLTASQQAAVDLVSTLSQVEYLLVGGGGGGAAGFQSAGGGGGAGQVSTGNVLLTKNVTSNIIIGSGGIASYAAGSDYGTNGVSSYLRNGTTILTAIGGGYSGYNGNPGGSGGGASNREPSNPVPGGVTTLVYGGSAFFGVGSGGYPGGAHLASLPHFAGGGGGAGGYGGNTSPNGGGVGGIGLSISWMPSFYGTPGPQPGRYFGGGGGGGMGTFRPAVPSPTIAGGAGGGGSGTSSDGPGAIINGTTNTGGGGGGTAYNYPASYPGGPWGSGGSGIAALKFPTSLSYSATGANVNVSGTDVVLVWTSSGTVTFT